MTGIEVMLGPDDGEEDVGEDGAGKGVRSVDGSESESIRAGCEG